MSQKLEIIGNYLVITDTSTNETVEYPVNFVRYKDDGVNIYLSWLGNSSQDTVYRLVDFVNSDGVAFANMQTLLDWFREFTGASVIATKTNVLAFDAWGRQKSTIDHSVVHGMFTNSVPNGVWKETFNDVERTITNATSLNGKLHLIAGATLNDVTVLDTYRNPRYEPNRGLIYSTSAFLPLPNALGNRRIGYFTKESGAFFSLESGILYAVVRTTIDSVVSEDKYIIDITNIDLSKGNTFDIQMQWRGVGNYRFFINLKEVKVISYLGTLTELTMFNPANPIAFECENLGDNVVIECGCVDISSEGGGVNGKTYGSVGVNNQSGQVDITGYNVPVIAIRSKINVNGKRNTRDITALAASAYSNQKSMFRIWATRDFTAITANNQSWTNYGDGHLEYIVYDVPDVVTPMTFNTAKATLIFGSRVDLDAPFVTTALFDGITNINLNAGEMFVFTLHRENGINATVGCTFEFAEEI